MRRSLAGSGTPVAVCEPHGRSMNASVSGAVGSPTSKTCRPSSPAMTGSSPHGQPPAGMPFELAESHERVMMSP